MKNAPVIIVQLIHIEGPMKGEIQEYSDPEISIGRNPSCQVQFPKDETSISRMHATIVREGNRFKIVNHGANGTLLNGKRIEEEYLKDGDVLTIAEGGPKVSFLTEIKEEGYIPPPPPQPDEPPQVTPPAPPEPPVSPPQPETPAPQVQREPVAPVPQQPASPTPPVQHQQAQPQPEMPAPQVQREPAAPVPRQPASPPPPVQHQPVQPPPPVPPVQYTPPTPPPPPQPKPAVPQDMQILRTKTPLIIQYGPTLKSYNELPITIGKNASCAFVINNPAILDQHAQFFFSQDQYWIKDLTGQQTISINGQPVDLQTPLNPDDILALSSSGPSFRFLGGGRLVEFEEPVREEPLHEKPKDVPQNEREAPSAMDQADKVIKGAKSLFDKFIKR